MNKEQRVIDLILDYGWIDGGHHKQWVLTEILKILMGDAYDAWLEDYNSDEEYSDWDEGIAP